MIKKAYTLTVIKSMIRREIENDFKGVMSDFARSIDPDPSFISYVSKFLSGKYKKPDKRILDHFGLTDSPQLVYYKKEST